MPNALVTNTLKPEEVLARPQVQLACNYFEENAEEITNEHIVITSIPAPPFEEKERAEFIWERFRQLGLEGGIDNEGNCVGLRKGHSLEPLIVVSAHLDTVFPAGTDVRVHHSKNKLCAPGIADDGCGLIALLALIKSLDSAHIETEGSILFVGTVGEEGEGNLRGVRYLFTEGPWAKRISSFISFDGPGVERIINQALGSRRYRVSVSGPGGHSWSDFGLANPVHALGRAISRLASYPVPVEPRTTFNVGRIEGGTSINAIASEAAMDVDLRSISDRELKRLDAFFRRAMREAADDENATRRHGYPPLDLNVQLIGERPTGETPEESYIVQIAKAATKLVGITPKLDQASTDSNLPISLGIPAVTLGAGGTSGNSHTLDEWYDPRDRSRGLKRGLLVALSLAGLKPT
jgi:acetylornithine deacetylase/succinyl-diaminopimelate desuccinylase-like protein